MAANKDSAGRVYFQEPEVSSRLERRSESERYRFDVLADKLHNLRKGNQGFQQGLLIARRLKIG